MKLTLFTYLLHLWVCCIRFTIPYWLMNFLFEFSVIPLINWFHVPLSLKDSRNSATIQLLRHSFFGANLPDHWFLSYDWLNSLKFEWLNTIIYFSLPHQPTYSSNPWFHLLMSLRFQLISRFLILIE